MKRTVGTIIAIISLFIISGCPMPLIGLGDKVDLDVPEITIASHENGDYVNGTITLVGGLADDVGVEEVNVTFDRGDTWSEANIDTENSEWNYEIDTTAHSDGEKELIITVVDVSQKVVELRLLLYFDNGAPVVMFKLPQGYASNQFNGDISIKGETADQFGIQRVDISVFDAEGNAVIEPVAAAGTNSWSYIFKSKDYVESGTASFSVAATAYDYSGNSNTFVYHYDDVFEQNNSNAVTVEQLALLQSGQMVENLSLDSTSLVEIRSAAVPITVNQNLDLPEFIISNPDGDSAADQNILPSNAKAIGMVLDDDGIKSGTIKIAIDSETVWSSVDAEIGSGISVRWQHDLSSLSGGNHYLKIKADDINGISAESPKVYFIIDTGAPVLDVTSPGQSSYFADDFTIEGTASDNEGVVGVWVLTDGVTENAAADTGSGYDTWSYVAAVPGGGLSDGNRTIKIKAEDETGKVSFFNLFVVIDTEDPTLSFLNPLNSASVNGDVLLKGTSSDNSQLQSVELKIGANEPWTTLAGTYNWEYLINSPSFANATDAVETAPSSDVWKLNVQARATDLAGNTATISDYFIYIDNDLDLPEFIISNPDADFPADQNILPSNARAIGMVLDDDGIEPGTIQIAIDSETVWNPIETEIGSGLSVRWQHDLSSLSGGNHYLKIKAEDINGVSSVSQKAYFIIDTGAPVIDVTSPAQSAYFGDDFTIEGTASDNEGVVGVWVITDGVTENAATDTGSGYDTWSYSAPVPGGGLTNGTRTIKIKAEDQTGKNSIFNLLVVIDTEDPSLSFLNPQNSSSVNGEVLLKGTASDNTQLQSVELKIGADEPWTTLTGTYNWEHTIDSQSYANATDSVESPPASDIWKLNVQARATDLAGNTGTVSDFFIYIDNDLDKPTISIISPSEGQNIGGTVLITGTAFDDDALDHIEMKIDLNGDGDYLDQIDLNGDFDTLDQFEDEDTWYPIVGTSFWTQELNVSGELYESEPGHDGQVTILVRAVDINFLEGNAQELNIRFDNTIPRVEGLSHESSDYVKGIFALTGDVFDDEEISSISISYDGGMSYSNVIADSGKVTENAVNDYDLHIDIDSAAYIAASGVLYLRLKVIDNANYQTISYINLNVDNEYPAGTFVGSSDDIYGDSTNARMQGAATDSGAVSGIEQIHIYFVRNTDVYNPQTGASTAVGSTDFGDGNGTVPYIFDEDFLLAIDDHNEFGNDAGGNGDGDGINESISLSGSTYNWWAEFDSTVLQDGAVDIHYVVFDSAGNGHHYLQSGFIKNNKPSIDSIVVGSDIDVNDTVDFDEKFTYSGSFSARNRLYIEINASDNQALTDYRVYHPAAAGTEVLSSSSGTLLATPAEYSDGPTDFLIRVTDSDGIIIETTIDVTFENVDGIAPAISINAITAGDLIDGHVEVDGTSLFHGTDADVSGSLDISGSASDNQRIKQIEFSIAGFDAGNGTGNSIVAASWDTTELVSDDINFVIDTQSLTESGGHQITWHYIWDSAEITGSAGTDIVIQVDIADHKTIANTDSDTLTIDVVPYISRVETTITDAFSDEFSRSAVGRYPVLIDTVNLSYEIITVHGYNLNPVAVGAGSDVRISKDADGLDGVTKKGTGLPYANVAADYTSLDVTIEASGSGYLNVHSNGIATINNINSNAANSEGDYINPNLTDDRYLSVWDINKLRETVSAANNAVYPSMALNGNTPVFAYVNNAAGYGRAKYWDGTTEKQVYDNWDLFTYTAIDVNSSGNHAVLFDINVVNGNYGDTNSGNYGGILTSYFYDVPAHSWYPGSLYFKDNHIWLDNLVDTTVPQTSAVLDRYQYPDLVVNANGTTTETRVFYSVYDRMEDEIIFRTFRVGTDNTIDDTSGGRVNDEGTALYTDLEQYNENGTYPTYNQGNNTNNKRFASSNNAGKSPVGSHLIDDVNTGDFTAVAGTVDGGVAVIVYYDAAGTGNLRLKYNTTPDNPATWLAIGGNELIDSGRGGEYVDMAIDSGDNIHIAYYDNNNGDLRYIYIPVTNFGTGSFGTIAKARVDSYFDVGEKLTLRVDGNDVPYISYKGINRTGKVAWLVGALGDGANSSDEFTGAWEIQILPTLIDDSDSNRFSVGLDGNDLPVVGYTNGGLEYVRLLAELLD